MAGVISGLLKIRDCRKLSSINGTHLERVICYVTKASAVFDASENLFRKLWEVTMKTVWKINSFFTKLKDVLWGPSSPTNMFIFVTFCLLSIDWVTTNLRKRGKQCFARCFMKESKTVYIFLIMNYRWFLETSGWVCILIGSIFTRFGSGKRDWDIDKGWIFLMHVWCQPWGMPEGHRTDRGRTYTEWKQKLD